MRAFVPVFEYKIIIGSGYVKYTLPISLCNAKHKNAKGTYFFLLNSAVYLSALRKEERIIYIFFFFFFFYINRQISHCRNTKPVGTFIAAEAA